MKKNILFVHEVASQAEILGNGICKNYSLNYNINRIIYFNHKYYKNSSNYNNNLYDAKLNINLYKKGLFGKMIIGLRLLLFLFKNFSIINNADIIHFFSGSSFLPLNIDLFFLRKIIKKKIIMEYNGSEIRQPNFSNKINIFYKFSEGGNYFSDKVVKNRINKRNKYFDKIIIPYPELFLQINNIGIDLNKIFMLPHIIDFEILYNLKNQNNNKLTTIKILHAPSNINTKGTIYIRHIVKQLKFKYNFIEYIEITNKSREEVFEQLRETDIVIDQMLIGDFGIFALESMGAGITTISYLLDEVIDKYPNDLPIINANLFTLYGKLEELFLNRDDINIIGNKSKDYVKKYHSENIILEQYKKILDSI